MLPHMGGVESKNSALTAVISGEKGKPEQNFGPVQAAGEPRGKHASVIMCSCFKADEPKKCKRCFDYC